MVPQGAINPVRPEGGDCTQTLFDEKEVFLKFPLFGGVPSTNKRCIKTLRLSSWSEIGEPKNKPGLHPLEGERPGLRYPDLPENDKAGKG